MKEAEDFDNETVAILDNKYSKRVSYSQYAKYNPGKFVLPKTFELFKEKIYSYKVFLNIK